MVWVRSTSKAAIDISADVDTVRTFLLDVPACGRLMPSVQSLEPLGDGVYHYRLEEFSNGAVSLAPDYEARFDVSDPAAIRWEPHGEHNFRSWGVFATMPGPVAGETVLEIDTHADADLAVASVMVPLVRPFANRSSATVTKGFLHNIKAAIESHNEGR
jgi:carbon monoxide dehydrogenase subunit G